MAKKRPSGGRSPSGRPGGAGRPRSPQSPKASGRPPGPRADSTGAPPPEIADGDRAEALTPQDAPRDAQGKPGDGK